QAALSARHQRAADAVPRCQRRRRGVRLHAGRRRGTGAQPRAARKDGAGRGALPDALRPALRLCARPSHGRAPERHRGALRRRVARSTYGGRWREMVNRSALTLKLLTSRQHGSIVAAPTFGLPETIGAGRNWDYRYTWIRDSSFTLYGLMRLGYTQEAAAFMRWVMARIQELKPDGSLLIMYGLDGRHELREETLPHLEGYMGSRPVRIGNAAHVHLQ